jgi:spore coat protein CotH
MMNQNVMKLAIFVSTVAILGTAALIVNPGKMAYAQGNLTAQGNMTAVIDVDTLSKNIKERHPVLAQMQANEDADLVAKIKGLDSKEAVKTVIALNMLRLLEQYKEVDAAK